MFVDLDPGTFDLNPKCIEAAVSARTRAIMPVYLCLARCATWTR